MTNLNSNYDVIIIGSGLFGSMTAKYLRSKGLEVCIIDNKQPMAASKCSFGIWKPGWINDKIKEEVKISTRLLEKEFEIVEKHFLNMDKDREELYMWLDCKQILNEKSIRKDVQGVKAKKVFIHDTLDVMKANKAVIVCAGVWTEELLIKSGYIAPKVEWNWGATLDIKGKIDGSRIKTWAPYKQNVLLKLSENKFIFGDGATVKNPTSDDKRVDMASDRLLLHAADTIGKSFDPKAITAINEGYRPYLGKGNKQFVNVHEKGLISATGGAKNSTVLCGFVAQEIWRLIKPRKDN